MKIIIQEVYVKNLYKNIKKEYRKKLSLNDMYAFNKIDPTSFMRRKEVAGNFLSWIIDDYFKRFENKITIKDYPKSEEAGEINSLLHKFNVLKNRNMLRDNDIFNYSFNLLIATIKHFEKKDGPIFAKRATEGRDYKILKDNNVKTVYKIKTIEGSYIMGKYTNWCITKDKTFMAEVREYVKQKYRILFIKSKKEKNTARDSKGKLMFEKSPEWYCIIETPEGEPLEAVDANNRGLFYTKKLEFVLDLIRGV